MGIRFFIRARRLARAVTREGWGLFVAAVFAVVAVHLYKTTPSAETPASDGFYSWIYARSLAFDGDIDFTDDYAACGDPDQVGADQRGTKHPDNIFYPGPALVWAPALRLLRATHFAPMDAKAGCGRPWTTKVLMLSPLFAAGAVFFAYVFARRWLSPGTAALGTALVASSPWLFRYAAVMPSYSHVYDAFFVGLMLCALNSALWRPERLWSWVGVSLSLAAAVFQRASNIVFVVVPVVCAVAALRARRRGGTSEASRPGGGYKTVFVVALLGAGALLGAAPLIAISRYLYGGPFVFTHGRYFMHPRHAHPLLVLFDQEEGLLFYAPAVWLSFVGLAVGIARRRLPLPVALLSLAGAAELFVSSSALDWSPSRRLLNLLPLFAVGAGFALARAKAWLEARSSRVWVCAGVLLALPFAMEGIGHGFASSHDSVGVNRPLDQADLYGVSVGSFWREVDRLVGPVSVLPAALAFHWRYDLPVQRFGDAIYARGYERDFRSLAWVDRSISFSDVTVRSLTTYAAASPSGVRPTGPRVTVVFSPQWPYATDATLKVRATVANRARVGLGKTFGGVTWLGAAEEVPGDGEAHTLSFRVPSGVFGLGLTEVVVQLEEHDLDKVELLELGFDDTTRRPGAFEAAR